MKLCFLIDDNKHWALIDLFCDQICMHYLSFPLLLSSGLLLLLSGRNMCSFVPQGRRALAFDRVIVFLEIKQLNFPFAVSFFPFKVDFDCDEIVFFDWW